MGRYLDLLRNAAPMGALSRTEPCDQSDKSDERRDARSPLVASVASVATPPALSEPPAPAADRASAIWGEREAERAAIVQYEGNIPPDWAEGFACLDPD